MAKVIGGGGALLLLALAAAMLLMPLAAAAPQVAAAAEQAAQLAEQAAAPLAAAEVIIPPALPGVPEPGDHILHHPRGGKEAAIKTAVWVTVWNAVISRRPPTGCYERARDGAHLILYLTETVAKSTGGEYRNLAIVLNKKSSAFWGVQVDENLRLTQSEMSAFILMDPCPPLDNIRGWAP